MVVSQIGHSEHDGPRHARCKVTQLMVATCAGEAGRSYACTVSYFYPLIGPQRTRRHYGSNRSPAGYTLPFLARVAQESATGERDQQQCHHNSALSEANSSHIGPSSACMEAYK